MKPRIRTAYLIVMTIVLIITFSLTIYWYGWKLALIIFLLWLWVKADFMRIPETWKQKE